MPTPQIPAGLLSSPMVDDKGMLTSIWQRWLTETMTRTVSSLTLQGEITKTTAIHGRTEPLAQTVQNVDAGGVITEKGVDLSRPYVNKTTDFINDGTGTPLTGGARAAKALDVNSRLAGSFYNTPVNTSTTPTASVALTNDGVNTAIQIPASANQYDFGTVNYGSGSVDPGAFGTWYVSADDPTYSGGTVIYQFSPTPVSQTAAPGRVPFGAITTKAAAIASGGGYSGGTTPNSAGGRGYIA